MGGWSSSITLFIIVTGEASRLNRFVGLVTAPELCWVVVTVKFWPLLVISAITLLLDSLAAFFRLSLTMDRKLQSDQRQDSLR